MEIKILTKVPKKGLLIVVIVFLFFLTGVFFWWGGGTPGRKAVQVSVATIKTGNFEKLETIEGSVEPEEVFVVSSKVGGKVQKLWACKGDRVNKGDLLVELDTSDLLVQKKEKEAKVMVAEGRLAKAKRGTSRQEIAKARNELLEVQGELEIAKKDLARTKELYKQGAVSLQSLEQAELKFNTANLEAQSAYQQVALLEEGTTEEDLKVLTGELLAARADLENINNQLAYVSIYSPVDGMILSDTDLNIGKMVSAGAELIKLGRLGDLMVKAEVKENLLPYIKLGTEVELFSEALPGYPLKGEIQQIKTVTDTSLLKVTETDYPVEIKLQAPPPNLRPGMTSSFDIKIKGENAVLVPKQCVLQKGKQTYLVKVEKGKGYSKQIITGIANDDYLQVLNGIRAGDMVIENPTSDWVDGTSVVIEE